MAKTNSTSKRSEPMDVMFPQSLGVIAAWPGIFHVLGGQAENFEITPEGINIRGLTMTTDFGVNPETVVEDVNRRDRRTQLWPNILYINGTEPPHFPLANDVTLFGVQYFKGGADSGSTGTPKYWRDAVAAYKASRPDISSRKRGPKQTRINLKDLTNLDPNVLQVADIDGLEHLAELVQSQLETRQANAAVETTS